MKILAYNILHQLHVNMSQLSMIVHSTGVRRPLVYLV